MTRAHVAVIGQGYVGLPVAHAAVNAGHTVLGYDVDHQKITALAEGRSPIDDITDGDLAAMHDTGRYQPTEDPAALAACTVYVVTVPTPLRDNRPDLTAVLAAARTVAAHLNDGDLVVLESTVAPGTTSGVFRAALDGHATGVPAYLLGFSPERIDPGNPYWRFGNTPKLVAGATRGSARAVRAFYATICDTVVDCSSVETAEMAKLLENTYRYVNIALVNELGQHAHAMGVDIWSVVAAASTKPYGFAPFWPGPGVGGHCLPVDPFYLEDGVEQTLGTGFDIIHAAGRVNAGQPGYVVSRAAQLLNEHRKPVNGSTVLVLGVSYKAGTADMRETPAVRIVEKLRAAGAVVIVADPHLHGDLPGYPDVKVSPSGSPDLARLAADVDLIVLATDHDEFPYGEVAATGRPILDTRNRFTPATNISSL